MLPVPVVDEPPFVLTGEMGRRAGPAVVRRLFDQVGSHGVEIDVSEGCGQVRGAERAGVEAVLPEVSAAAVEPVETHGVVPVGLSEGFGEGVRVVRDGDHVDMICHQAVAQDGEPELLTLLAERLEVELSVFVGEEYVLAVVAPLGDVVWNGLHHHARLSRHESSSVI